MFLLDIWQNVLFAAFIIVALLGIFFAAYLTLDYRNTLPNKKVVRWVLVILGISALVCIVALLKTFGQEVNSLSVLIAASVFLSSLAIIFYSAIPFGLLSDLKKANALVHFHTTHDDLTGLPNLSYFNDQLEKTLGVSRREEDEFALLIIGLNRFKVINETLGYFVGDAILQEIAHRIRASLRKTDLIARLGGDEFAVLINPVGTRGHIHTISKNIAESVKEPLAIEGKPTDVGVSIGVAIFPKHAANSVELIEKARNSMIAAEKQGDSILIYDRAETDSHIEDIQIIGMLQRAIQDDQLTVLYQPQVRLDNEKIISAEALIRWQHPNYGLLDPGRFIPYAERAGLIYEINLWLLKKITNLLADWREKNIHLLIAMNITANGFLNKEFQQELNALIKNNAWIANMLKVELTETSNIDNVDEIYAAMTEFKKHGLVFSLDDYGTKHASLEYLKKLPFDELKIDQSFMFNAATDEDSRAIIQHAKEIAKQLKLTTTAEGIESEEVLEIAKKYGINCGQGYYFSSAIQAIELESNIRI